MVTNSQIVQIVLSSAELNFIRSFAKVAEIGGRSEIYKDNEERQKRLAENQLTGQIGTYAGHKYWFGHTHLYRVGRYYANKYPFSGDGGSDVPGANIDFKATLARNLSRDILDYDLLVREKEYKPETIYVHILVIADFEQNQSAVVNINGWATGNMLRYYTKEEAEKARLPKGFFGYALGVRNLNPLPPVSWAYN